MDRYEHLLERVIRPASYLGNELNAVHKDWATLDLTVALAFPDSYEMGMSHLGLKILYDILNKRPDTACERVFTPWVDMIELLRAEKEPLRSLESHRPLADFDVIGFSLPHELVFTNVVQMLDLAQIPLRAADRNTPGTRWPLILGGGVATMNPEPVADFFDAFLLGEGEDAVTQIANAVLAWKKSGADKRALLDSLSTIQGVYIPSFFDVTYHDDGRVREICPLKPGYETVTKAVVLDMSSAPFPSAPVVPNTELVHDRVAVEIMRGCTHGCRFCQAGMVYRPTRERRPEVIRDLVLENLRNTGDNDVSLLSLSSGDYSCLIELMEALTPDLQDKGVAVSLPSLWVESLTPELVAQIKKLKKSGGFTIAPEAGSQRLRHAINKHFSDAAVLETARHVFAAGWRQIKMYFMVGLPTETPDDIAAIAELSKAVFGVGRELGISPSVSTSISPFVPKPHTPYQWEPQIHVEAVKDAKLQLKRALARSPVRLKGHDPDMSYIEGVLSRGDRRLSRLFEVALTRGHVYDGWKDHFSMDKWRETFTAAGVDPDWYAYRRRDFDEVLPWDHLASGVTKKYLRTELERGLATAETLDCKTEGCTKFCGVCDFKELEPHNVTCEGLTAADALRRRRVPPVQMPALYARYRFRFEKLGLARFYGHLDLARLFTRAFRRAEIPLKLSQGFAPAPKISVAYALPLGVESTAEYLDIEVRRGLSPAEVMRRLAGLLPEGVRVTLAEEVPASAPSTAQSTRAFKYRIGLRNGAPPDVGRMTEAVHRFAESAVWPVMRKTKHGLKQDDLKRWVEEARVLPTGDAELTLRTVEGGSCKPDEAFRSLFGVATEDAPSLRIVKFESVLTPPPPPKYGPGGQGPRRDVGGRGYRAPRGRQPSPSASS